MVSFKIHVLFHDTLKHIDVTLTSNVVEQFVSIFLWLILTETLVVTDCYQIEVCSWDKF